MGAEQIKISPPQKLNSSHRLERECGFTDSPIDQMTLMIKVKDAFSHTASTKSSSQ